MSVDLPIASESSPDDDDLFGDNDGSEGNEDQASPSQHDEAQEVDSPDDDDEDGDEDEDEDAEGEDESDEEDSNEEDSNEGDSNEDQEDADGDVDMDAEGEQDEEDAPPQDVEMAIPSRLSTPAAARSPLAPIPANIIRRQRFVPPFDPLKPPKSLSLDPFISIAHPTATHALAATPCMSYLLTGSQDGYNRCYDFYASANGKSLMTAQARGVANLGDAVTKGGVARGFWKNEVDVEEPEEADKPKPKPVTNAPAWLQVEAVNEEPATPRKMVMRRKLEPVYSLAIQGDALWALSGSKTGAINLSTVRHAPGTIAHVLRGHLGPISSLTLFNDDHSLLSGSWDKSVKQWDLNTGQVVREFTKHGAHISAVQLRPAARPMPASVDESSNESGVKIIFSPKAEKEKVDVEMADVDGAAKDAVKDDDLKSEASFGSLFGDEDNEGKPGDPSDQSRRPSTNQQAATPAHKPVADAKAETDPAATKQEQPMPEIKPKELKAHKRRPSTAAKTAKKDAGAALYSDDDEAANDAPAPRFSASNAPLPNVLKDKLPTLSPATYRDYSDDVILVASMDGQVALHDRRVGSSLVGSLETSDRTPPWCMSACWSSDGRQVIAGRRQNTVDVWDVRKMGRSGSSSAPTLLRSLKNPAGSGPVSCVAAFPDGQHIACASHDTLRLWNTAELWNSGDNLGKKKSGVPFRIVAGHRSGTVSAMLIDPTCKYLVTATGDRGWTGETTQTVLVHEIKT